MSETPDTPSTEARPHDPFCVMFGINDLMQGRESDCTCATRRSDTPSTEALTPPCICPGYNGYPRGDRHAPECETYQDGYYDGGAAERAVRQEAADTSDPESWNNGYLAGQDDAEKEAADTSGHEGCETRCRCWSRGANDEATATDRAALRGATERPLDVERLARIIHDYEKVKGHPGCGWKFDSTMPDGTPLCPCRGYAARLASPTTTEEA